jgi:hypothetical protein
MAPVLAMLRRPSNLGRIIARIIASLAALLAAALMGYLAGVSRSSSSSAASVAHAVAGPLDGHDQGDGSTPRSGPGDADTARRATIVWPRQALPGSGSASQSAADSLPGVSAETLARVEQDASAELEKAKREFVDVYWKQMAGQWPSSATFTYNLSFDPDGHEIARGVSDGEGVAPEISESIKEGLSSPIKVAPPGRYVGVSLVLTVP